MTYTLDIPAGLAGRLIAVAYREYCGALDGREANNDDARADAEAAVTATLTGSPETERYSTPGVATWITTVAIEYATANAFPFVEVAA